MYHNLVKDFYKTCSQFTQSPYLFVIMNKTNYQTIFQKYHQQ